MGRLHAIARRCRPRSGGPTVPVLGVSLLLLLFAVALYPTVRADGHQPALSLPWWALALLSAVCELAVLHIQVRRDAHALSLNELATVIGLFFCTPTDYLAGRLAGTLLAMVVVRRQAPLKATFNLCLATAEAVGALAVFHLVWQPAAPIAPLGWAGAVAAAGFAAVFSAVAVTSVIALVDRELRPVAFLRESLRGAVGSAVATGVALVCVHALVEDNWAIVPIATSLLLLLLGYRAYSGLSERHLSLERLYRFSHVVAATPEVDDILLGVLQHAQEVLRAEHAEVIMLAEEPTRPAARIGLDAAQVGLDARQSLQREQLLDGERDDPVWARVLGGGAPLLIPRWSRDPALRAFLRSRGLRDAVVAPLRGESGVIGAILTGDRLGEFRSFDTADVLLLETVANHAGTALQNGELIHRRRHDELHDPLTGLPNRATFNRALADAVADVRARRSPGLTVMVLDLIDFKQVNDTLGHQMGDQLLREVAVRLAGVLAETPATRKVVARKAVAAGLGGDDFAILLPEVDQPQEAIDCGDLLRRTIEQPVRIDGVDVEVQVSIGICQAPQHGLDGLDLIRRADAARYEAKQIGNGVQLYRSGLDQVADPARLALVGELRQGIEGGQLEVHLQPQADARTGQVLAVEALVRWRHPRRGLLFPDEFIPIAERSGLIRPLTRSVLEQSLLLCGQWWRAGRQLSVAVNLSARGIVDAGLIEAVEQGLRANALPPSALCLEITESSVIADPDRTIAVLERLHELGVRLSIDDFGTGYTSLSYLRRLPVQEVKIDKSFVMTMRSEQDNAAIVRSIIDLAANLGLQVVAEGVEDGQTWAELVTMGCDLVQGYHLAKPMPAEQLPQWLEAHRTVPTG